MRRATVLRELDETYANPHSQTSPCLFRINMIFAIGAVALFRSGLHDVSPMDYYAAAMQRANKTFELAGLEQIQALLLVLIFSLQHDIGGKAILVFLGPGYSKTDTHVQWETNGTSPVLPCEYASRTTSI